MGVPFILFLGLFGLPPILFVGVTAGVVLGHARALARRHPWRLALVGALMVLAALPALPFAVVLAGEVLIQWRCDGAACAQGGVGVLLVAHRLAGRCAAVRHGQTGFQWPLPTPPDRQIAPVHPGAWPTMGEVAP